jgi:hypothetical protein
VPRNDLIEPRTSPDYVGDPRILAQEAGSIPFAAKRQDRLNRYPLDICSLKTASCVASYLSST